MEKTYAIRIWDKKNKSHWFFLKDVQSNGTPIVGSKDEAYLWKYKAWALKRLKKVKADYKGQLFASTIDAEVVTLY